MPEQLAGTAAELEAVAVAPTADDALDQAALDALRITELITGTAAAVAELDEEALDREAAEALAENGRLRAEYGSDDEEVSSSPRDIMQWLQDVIDDQPSRDPRIAEAWAASEKEDGALSTDRMPDKAAIEAAERALDEEAARAPASRSTASSTTTRTTTPRRRPSSGNWIGTWRGRPRIGSTI